MTSSRSKPKTQLIVERSDGELWGRIEINDNLIVDVATDLKSLQRQLKALALDIEGVEITDFEISYDLTSFFKEYNYLNITDVANKAGINPGLMRQYSSGKKFPSLDRVKEIEKAIHDIGRELLHVKLHKAQKELA